MADNPEIIAKMAELLARRKIIADAADNERLKLGNGTRANQSTIHDCNRHSAAYPPSVPPSPAAT